VPKEKSQQTPKKTPLFFQSRKTAKKKPPPSQVLTQWRNVMTKENDIEIADMEGEQIIIENSPHHSSMIRQ
jgi:hypothetical protein